uniref:Zinc finger CCCH domain-containing protein 15 n=1 Tax=Daphnia sinensis TaxID=1820382 RepID=A0A4Y7NAG8_9CRUS|nr:EOG090X0C5B [Daphnia sinensis]SVE89485.1 EOG090X0C5B [Daphnia sinensis]SVE90110.1 EOG090X0C5B [Daphnia sinensis]SVE90738.1 EOG090X0C5B [Daphnia sinensis]SVE91365.1 EOG090X0C5B [Daphnia sinensis]
MGPKTNSGASKAKVENKKKEKIIEDKTFGLKNKKGGKNQKFIAQVQQQVKHGGSAAAKKLEDEKRLQKEKKEAELRAQKEMQDLFKPVQPVQKVEKGADPKSILCAFFKQGTCGKGDRCKFSHDLEIERKAEKRSLYCDVRDEEKEGTNEDWDEEKLKDVIEKKHAEADKKKTKTDIICKHFLDAVEKNKYGWFWQCPSGESCIYRHALPPGFVLKKDKKKEDKKEEISLEDLVEKERAALGPKQTKVTLETFLAWKKRKLREREESSNKENTRKQAAFKAGRSVGISGREMFTFNPDLARDDNMEDGDEAFDTANLPIEEEESEVQYRELDLNALACVGTDVDGSGTVAPASREYQLVDVEESTKNGNAESLDEAAASVPIDENLFADEDDLDDLEDELDELDVND